MTFAQEIARRRTFAIISHPDAGKTTLTEKLLYFGGAIQMAGAVKARGEQRRAHSDWLKVERERGISVATSVMSFDYAGSRLNLLDTPGHEDFSEDTYRTLTAVDSAIMVLDGAKGIEGQTKKLFEVTRMRDIPVVTFINKFDREAQDPFTLLDQIEQDLQLHVVPASWPIGMGKDFLGCYDLFNDQLLLMKPKASPQEIKESAISINGLNDPKLDEHLPDWAVSKLREEVEMARELCPEFDHGLYLEGHLTPVWFGSALNNFGVLELMDGICKYAPAPRPQPAVERMVEPSEDKVNGVVFRIQANMDPNHRDRIGFVRICSGHFKKGMKLKHSRTEKAITIHSPAMFMANEREVAEEAFPGDIIGIPNHGNLGIGDSLCEGEMLHFTGIPSFAPELLQRVRPSDPLKAKHLSKALQQLAEEGVARVFKPVMAGDWVIGAHGSLQFDVMADRIRTEYNVPVIFEPSPLYTARWLVGEHADIKNFMDKNRGDTAHDHAERPVFLARNAWHLNNATETFPKVTFVKTLS
ncbi:MAG: peptide chain release factor 3 [Alphaproteobacteria bacterium]